MLWPDRGTNFDTPVTIPPGGARYMYCMRLGCVLAVSLAVSGIPLAVSLAVSRPAGGGVTYGLTCGLGGGLSGVKP